VGCRGGWREGSPNFGVRIVSAVQLRSRGDAIRSASTGVAWGSPYLPLLQGKKEKFAPG